MEKAGVDKVLDRHKKFWSRARVKRPLIGITEKKQEREVFLPQGPLAPTAFELDTLVERHRQTFARQGIWEGDLLNAAGPELLVPWVEAMAGVYIKVQGDTVWAEPPKASGDDILEKGIEHRYEWLNVLQESIRGLAEGLGPQSPVGMPNFHGPGDVIASLIGAEKMCLAIYEAPDKLRALVMDCAALLMRASEDIKRALPLFHGGYCHQRWQLWAPDAIYTLSNDHAALLSPKHCEDFFLPLDKMIVAGKKYTCVHLHSAYLHILDMYLDMPELALIEITCDPQPPLEELVSTFVRIQKKKLLMIHAPWSKPALEKTLDAVAPEGLCISARPGRTSPEALHLLKDLQQSEA